MLIYDTTSHTSSFSYDLLVFHPMVVVYFIWSFSDHFSVSFSICSFFYSRAQNNDCLDSTYKPGKGIGVGGGEAGAAASQKIFCEKIRVVCREFFGHWIKICNN